MTKPRIAIVSTFDDLCGIAGYTRYLLKQIENDFEVDVFDLDQFFMRGDGRRLRATADSMIKDFCAGANKYDFVNIQLEYGIIGRYQKDILRRFRWIAEAAPALSVTFHTIPQYTPLNVEDVLERLGKFQIHDAITLVRDHKDRGKLSSGIFGTMRRLAKKKTVNTIVHTRRDARVMRYIHRLPNVFDHPLAFLDAAQAAQLKATTNRSSFPILESLPADAKIVGVFGFLSEYKGFDTAVRALQFLPENYHLVFFGGVHPNEIKQKEKINPYVRSLLDLAYVDSSIADIAGPNVQLNLPITAVNDIGDFKHPRSLAHRIHFLGAQSDENFARGMSLCDTVVLPYLEVGQTSSGPISLAVEMEARIVAARNRAFLQFARYHPDRIEMFEIGNHLELAQRIMARPSHPPAASTAAYTTSTNRQLYVAANTHPSEAAPIDTSTVPR